jgi:hypothetical protein
MNGYPAALIEGELGLSQNCFTLVGPGGPWVLLWSGSYAPVVVDGKQGVAASGAVLAMVGQRLELGGGEVTDTEFAVELTNDSLPQNCRLGRYWIVAPR